MTNIIEANKMGENKIEVRTELANSLSDLAESIIKQKAPFEKGVWPCEICSEWYNKVFIKYAKHFTDEEKTKYLELRIESLKHFIRMELRLEEDTFNEKYPEKEEFIKKINKHLTKLSNEERRRNGHEIIVSDRPKIKDGSIIKEILKKRYPAFQFDKKESTGLEPVFSKDFAKGFKIFLEIHKATPKRSWFYFDIRVSKEADLFFRFDLCEFWDSKFSYKYETEEELKIGMDKALGILDVLLPHFEERVGKILEKYY